MIRPLIKCIAGSGTNLAGNRKGMGMDMRNRSAYIDSIRGFAILLVMLGHCIVLNGLEEGIVYDAVKAVQMPLFMVLSGYVAGAYTKIGSAEELWRKLGRRAVSYLIPFFVWIAVLHPMNIMDSIRIVLFRLDKGLWFLMVLFLMTAVMYIAVYIRRNKKYGVILFWGIWLLFSGLILLQYKSGSSFLSPHLTVFYIPFYMGGYLAALHADRILSVIGGQLGKAAAAAFLLFVVVIVKFDMVTADNTPQLLCQLAAGVLGCFLSAYLIFKIRVGRLRSALAYLGQYTLEIYVLHFHFASLLGLKEKGLSLYSVRGAAWVLAAFLLMSFLTWLSIVVLKRFRLTDFLLFGNF